MEASTESQGQEMKIYQVVSGDDAYLKIGNGAYKKTTLSSLAAQGGTTIEDFTKDQMWTGVSSDLDFELKGEKEYEGQAVYEYVVDLSDSQRESFVNSLTEGIKTGFEAGSGGQLSLNEDSIVVEGVEYTVMVAKKDMKPVAEFITIETLTLEVPNIATVGYENFKMQIVYKSVNKPVSIEIPKI
ncbi:MAG: hypothetical protein Fur003_5660 [Candidatus Dojkabacteria bacterium]